MPPRVRLLAAELADRIAAGEVIERPASAVKELVENALDARATEISVWIEEGGRSLIRVMDNGHGMSPDDARLAFRRHATSKIERAEDLERIATLGFRGEALPSIAAVSRVSMTTKCEDGLEGFRIRLEGGKVISEEPVGAPPGTAVEVESLFYNMPARLKFLRSARVEGARTASVVAELALASPCVRLSLKHPERTVAIFPPAQDEISRIVQVLGKGIEKRLIPLREAVGAVRISGAVVEPSRHVSNARSIYIIVNGRPVRDRTFLHAVMEGYREVLMRNRYPIAVVWLRVPPEIVDVNVHPTKREVGFSDAGALHESVRRAVARALAGVGGGAGARPAGEGAPGGLAKRPDPGAREQEPGSLAWEGRTAGARERSEPAYGYSELVPIGQAGGTYLVCASSEGLVILDQHAAHERVTYENLRRAYREAGIEQQMLLIPEVVDLDPRRSALAVEMTERLATLGYALEAFGGGTVKISAVPALLAGADHVTVLSEIIDAIEPSGAGDEGPAPEGSLGPAVARALATLACHGSVRANDPVSIDQIRSLLRQMDAIEWPTHCPHGRPVKCEIRFSELEHRFGRR